MLTRRRKVGVCFNSNSLSVFLLVHANNHTHNHAHNHTRTLRHGNNISTHNARHILHNNDTPRCSELVKTRMQVSGSTIQATVSGIASKEGIGAFWKGLAFAYGRELSYTSIKLGAYAPVRDLLGAGKESPIYLKFLAGALTGGFGSAVGNPFGEYRVSLNLEELPIF